MCEALKEIYLRQNREAYEKEKQAAVDAVIAEKNAIAAEKDAIVAEKDAIIADLKAQLAQKENS